MKHRGSDSCETKIWLLINERQVEKCCTAADQNLKKVWYGPSSPLIGSLLGATPDQIRAVILRLLLLQRTFDNGILIPTFLIGSSISQPKGFNVPSSIIEEDLTIEGKIASSEGTVDVKGLVVGDVSAETITVHVSGSVDGALSAKKITVEGKHRGSLSCDYLKLASTSQVQADVAAKEMEAEIGAKVKGKFDITGRQ